MRSETRRPAEQNVLEGRGTKMTMMQKDDLFGWVAAFFGKYAKLCAAPSPFVKSMSHYSVKKCNRKSDSGMYRHAC